MFSRKKNNNNEENLSLIGGKNHNNHNNNNYNNDDYAASASPPFNSPALAPSQQQHQHQQLTTTATTTANANAAIDDELVGIVYCCAQPTNFAHAPTFEWSSLDMNSSRVSCRKVVQRIFARIDTTSFGERRQYVNDLGNVQLLSIIGVDKCIFVVGCMKKDFLVDSDGGGDGGDGVVSGGSVMVEMDRLLVSMQRAFAQHVARQVGIGRRINNNNDKNQKKKLRGDGDDDNDQNENCKIDDESLSNFDTAIQNAIDDASNRIADVIYHSAAAATHNNNNQNNSSITGNGLLHPGPGLFRRFLPSSGSNGANSNSNNNNQQNQNNANRYGYQHHESVAATYLSGGTGADDFGFESGAGGVGTRQSFLFNLRKSQQRNRNNGEGDDDDFDEEAGDNWCCPPCCTTRVKLISCFVVVFVAAVVVFILLFVCERKGTNGFQLTCGN